MAVDCLRQPVLIAFAKTFGASIGILGAALAWLLNHALRWFLSVTSERRSEYELIKGIRAEFASNANSKRSGTDAAQAEQLIADLKSEPGPYKPWTPNFAVVDENFAFDNLKGSIIGFPVGLTKQLADFRSDAYAKLSHDRQKTFIRRAHALGADVALVSETAQAKLDQRMNRLFLAKIAFYCAATLSAASIAALVEFLAVELTPAVE
jgi:hypothetical protein